MAKLKVDLRGLIHLGNLSGGYFITTIVKNALPFLLLPVLTRYLDPKEYGIIALFSFYLSISNAINGVSIPTIIGKNFFSTSKKYIAELIGNSIFVVGVFSVFNVLIILIIYPFFKDSISLPLNWLLLVPLTSFAFIVFSLGINVMRNSKKVFAFGIHQVGNITINLLISLILVVLLAWGWQGRVLGIILSFVASAGFSFWYLKKNGFVVFAISKKIIKKILSLVLPLIPNSFQATIISQVGIFFIQYYYTKDLLGIYSLGFQLAVLIKILGDTLSMSWSPFLFEQMSGNKEINKLYLTRMLYALIGIVVAGVVFINLSAGLVLKVMSTPAYYGAKEFIPWFTLGFLFQECYVFLFPILIKHEKQKQIGLITILNMFLVVILNIWFVNLFGYIGISYAFCLSHLIMLIAYLWQVQRVMPLPWIKALKIW